MVRQPARVLVVDDEADLLGMLRVLLAQRGFDVRTASSGLEALALTSADPPDLMLLDVMMQDMDGWETLKLLKLEPSSRDVPVIILSARAEAKDKIRGLQEGAVDYVTKPFSPRELLAKVDAVLGIDRSERRTG
jgi:DNA-binding response OmpR family regulator